MDSDEFDKVLTDQMARVIEVLGSKAKEYATEDRLHNFKVAAILRGISPREAVAGMMVKHTISIYDMTSSNIEFIDDVWDEKITDHINYLILLRAVIQEEKGAI
jgi:hypothetical protein